MNSTAAQWLRLHVDWSEMVYPLSAGRAHRVSSELAAMRVEVMTPSSDASAMAEPRDVRLVIRGDMAFLTAESTFTVRVLPTSDAQSGALPPPGETASIPFRATEVFVREDQSYPDFKVRHALKVASWFYPDWDAGLAGALLDDFELPPGRAVRHLSRGMRSALGIVIGLAARAEVTLFDEPYAGLDPVARQLFYDRLLADLAEHPRTVLLSTHLIDEAAGLLERVVVVDRGKVVLDAAADQVRGSATSVSGPAATASIPRAWPVMT